MRRRSLRLRLARMLGVVGITCCAALAVSGCVAPPSGLTVTPIVTGLDHPWDVGFAGNTMIYTERPGRISAIVGGQKRLLAAPTRRGPGVGGRE